MFLKEINSVALNKHFLRYSFSGGIALVTFHLAYPGARGRIEQLPWILILSLILGAFIYCFHRALIHRIFYPALKKTFLSALRFAKKLDVARWESRKTPNSSFDPLSEWSDGDSGRSLR